MRKGTVFETLLVVVATLFYGCAGGGVPQTHVGWEQHNAVVLGMTLEQVQRTVGLPGQLVADEDGVQTWQWNGLRDDGPAVVRGSFVNDELVRWSWLTERYEEDSDG